MIRSTPRTARSTALVAVISTALVAALLPTAATAASRWSVRGAGWGHGIGMSQYGAYGYAKHGAGYREILHHYYEGTELQQRGNQTVRVLLQANKSAVYFRGGTTAGERSLNPDSLYKATRDAGEVVLRSASGRVLTRAEGVLTISSSARVRLLGYAANGVRDGLYRGSLEIRTATGPGLNAVNAVDLEGYVLGVVPNESPSSWPPAALQAQAVAARTYALSTGAGGRGFDQYADTRSQVYRGFLSESPTATAAVLATRGQIVTYNGAAAVTYFFSTSGGFTENVENVFTDGKPEPWLKGVEDPYDNSSPYHRWGPYTYTRRGVAAKLGSWVKGSFQGIKVLQRGVSPRVVRAEVRGSRGSTRVTGPQIRARMGLRDTWFYLRRVTSTTNGGASARTASGVRPLVAISGSVSSSQERFAKLQRLVGADWVTVVDVPLERSGGESHYRIHVGEAGRYRVLAGWAPGPTLDVAP
jgi:stage II sporulation protein D